MSCKKGFTLIEIIVVLIIVAILATVALTNYNTMMTQGAGKAAQNNLISIYNEQKNYYLSPANGGAYYSSGGNADDQAGIDAALSLAIVDNTYFKYTCATAAGPSFTCTATNRTDGNLVLTVTSGTPNAPNQIVLFGGVGCASNTGANPGCNPSCATDVTSYCSIS